VSGKNVPEKRNMGAMNNVAGYDIVSIDGEIAEKHDAIAENKIPARKRNGRAIRIPGGEARPKRSRIMLIAIADIRPRVAPHRISPIITSFKVMGVARMASKIF